MLVTMFDRLISSAAAARLQGELPWRCIVKPDQSCIVLELEVHLY